MSKKPVPKSISIGVKSTPAKPVPSKGPVKVTKAENIAQVEKQETKIAPKEVEPKLSKWTETNLKDFVSLIFNHPESTEPCYSLVDETTRVSAFLRHRDCCYVDIFDKISMQPERIRMAVISGIRFGKVLVFGVFIQDFMEMVDLLGNLKEVCSQVSPDLFSELCDRSILKDENYLKYVKETDGEQYKSFQFVENVNENFKVIFLSTKSSDQFLSLGKSFVIVP